MTPRHLFSYLALVLSFFASFTHASSETPPKYKGALCLIASHDGKIVMVREAITGQLSIPGGHVEEGEDPAKAAEREAWEESGLVVTAIGKLGVLGNAALYDCVSDSPVVAFNHKDEGGHNIVPAWFAPHYGIETKQVVLAHIAEVNKANYRYPSQIDALQYYSEKAARQKVAYIDDIVEAAIPFHQKEIRYIKALQEGVLSASPALLPYIHSFFYVGDILASPWMLIVLIPAAFMVFGRYFGAELLFAVVSVAVLALVAQVGVGFARPHAFMPELMLGDTFGFGMPSMTSALMVTVLGLFYLHATREYPIEMVRRYLPTIVVLVLFHGLSTVYLGAQYFTDVLAGMALGGMAVWHFNRLDKKDEVHTGEILSSASVWWVAVVIIAVLGTLWPRPDFAYWFATSIAIASVFTFLKPKVESRHRSVKHIVTVIFILMFANLLYSVVKTFLNYSSIIALVLEASRYPVLVLIFAITQLREGKDQTEKK
ncbi:putative nudix hydrolase and phosphatase/haloperoxidase domains containing protein [Vibrio nigripulchritudo SO65]|uniref:bifunctional NUDIX hydrolase/phosphatase PAP2 family protein n=1 Tax=Vibrio nigripulchritudo TaxID=28173 RepID=UPI0003B23EB8|nr:bifunctional NUDIX hydrolase/phosphatase PAP2 family protein [Vibrio nigripulchritudo]CCN36513.1 putative nudix hydrolase and phosphatase/haloperoxidase domains containing protein [Vibrio nigripulchritudo AM115]CCN43407.1 putative nudix hydrolase and phosphatase/haloperoxidase domains containing protein [Vibrio nigripulchritudo FTn2]CCN67625.1 putative nudix hydrolase and phosphatase/haloperoxidase domains containing protein [Vibrio nigripulchritudo POn4]CCN75235.1 putative nudix hydrolase a